MAVNSRKKNNNNNKNEVGEHKSDFFGVFCFLSFRGRPDHIMKKNKKKSKLCVCVGGGRGEGAGVGWGGGNCLLIIRQMFQLKLKTFIQSKTVPWLHKTFSAHGRVKKKERKKERGCDSFVLLFLQKGSSLSSDYFKY